MFVAPGVRLKSSGRWALGRSVKGLGLAALALAVLALTSCSGGDEVTGTTTAATTPNSANEAPARSVEQLADVVNGLAEAVANTPVIVATELGVARFTVDGLGIELDVDATLTAVRADRLGAGEEGAGSDETGDAEWQPNVNDPTAEHVRFAIDAEGLRTALDGATELAEAPTAPAVFEQNGTLAVHLGEPGTRVDADDLVAGVTAEVTELVAAASARGAPGAFHPIDVTALLEEVQPISATSDLQQALESANEQFGHPPTVRFVDEIRELPLATVSSWLQLEDTGISPRIEVDTDAVEASLAELFADANDAEGPAGFNVDYSTDSAGVPMIVNTEGGVRCCTLESIERLIEALARGGAGQVTLSARPAISSEDHERLAALGIVERVATYTTPHNPAPHPSRVTNIQLMADLVRGAVIEPGESFSINDHVGRRTRANGFVDGGALALGVLVKEVGGGVSQFATTAFNAAFFAGLDIDSYQMHSLYFARYPFGREATISYPEPDLRFTNNTDYGVLLWPRYTSTSISVDIFSTKNVWVTPEPASFVWQTWQCSGGAYHSNCRAAVASPYTVSRRQLCLRVTTTRNRRYEDGSTETDTFSNTYQPKEGYGCNGRPRDPAAKICPEPEPEVPPVDSADGDGAGPGDGSPADGGPADEAEPGDSSAENGSGAAGDETAGDETAGDDTSGSETAGEQSSAQQPDSEDAVPVATTTTTTVPAEPATPEEPEEPCWPLLPLPGEQSSGDAASADEQSG